MREISPASGTASARQYSRHLAPGVSVVIPSFQGRDHIGTCLRSLAAQSLDPDLFEVVVVLNGPADGTRNVLRRFRGQHPELELRVLEVLEAGAARARNLGIAAATREYTTFIDDDDSVSPGYLKTLLAYARPGVVSFAQIVNVDGVGKVDPANPINLQTISYAGRIIAPERVPRALGFNACKLISTDMVKTITYDPLLRSGIDVVFFMSLLAHHDFDIHVCPVASGPTAENAVYYRLLRPNSMSRRTPSFDFNVIGRLEVISRLDALTGLCDERKRRVLQTTMRSQVGHMNRYLDVYPEALDRVLGAIEDYRITSFPYDALALVPSPLSPAR